MIRRGIDYFRLQEHGAAFETGGLEVGQLILEVDGNKVEGMHHQVIVLNTNTKGNVNQKTNCLFKLQGCGTPYSRMFCKSR